MIDLKPIPFMAHEEIVLLDELIEHLHPKTCLEWGAGGSTLYFPNKHYQTISKWTSLESDKEWFNALLNKTPENVDLIFAFKPEVYINYPLIHKQKYDFILIDGLDETRVQCMEVAAKCLTPGGVAILHDAGRLRYRPGYQFFGYNIELAPGVGLDPKDGGADFRGLAKFWNE